MGVLARWLLLRQSLSLLHIQLLRMTPPKGNFLKWRQEQKKQKKKIKTQNRGYVQKGLKDLTQQTFGRIFLNFLWWLWDFKCGWRWSISPEEILSQPVICEAMSARRVFEYAQDSMGLQVPARARKDCASVFWTMLSLSLSSQQWRTGPLILWGQKHAKGFFLKGPGSGKSSGSQNISHNYAWFLLHAFLEILHCFFKAFKTISSTRSAGVSRKSLPWSPIPSAQVKTNQQNQWQKKIIHHPFHDLSNHSPSSAIKREGCVIPAEPQLLFSCPPLGLPQCLLLLQHCHHQRLPHFSCWAMQNTWGKEENREKQAGIKEALLTAKTRHAAANYTDLVRMVSSSAMQNSWKENTVHQPKFFMKQDVISKARDIRNVPDDTRIWTLKHCCLGTHPSR